MLEDTEGRILVIKYELDSTLLKKGVKANKIKTNKQKKN